MFKIGDVLTDENYTEAAIWCNENGLVINNNTICKHPDAPKPTYQELRVAEYPTIGDQLDMIYWDKVNGSNIWQETIAAVKAKYPKPAEEGDEIAE